MILNKFIIKRTLTDILFGNKITESIQDNQIIDYLYSVLICESLLWGEPLTINELKNILRKKIVNFEFIKLDGTVRPAKGSTNLKYVPRVNWPKGTAPEATVKRLKKVATFYDLMKKEWRSVSNRSKEIVLKKDIEKKKSIVVVVDKPKGMDKEKEIIKKITKNIDNKKKLLHFRNMITGATIDYNITQTEAENKIKQLGKNWEILSDEELKNKNKQMNLMVKDINKYNSEQKQNEK